MEEEMKKNIRILLIGLAVLLQGTTAFAVDSLLPMKPVQMQQFEDGPFDNYKPDEIENTRKKKQEAQEAEGKAQEQIEERLNQIEKATALRGQVQDQVYIYVQRVEFPKSAIL